MSPIAWAGVVAISLVMVFAQVQLFTIRDLLKDIRDQNGRKHS